MPAAEARIPVTDAGLLRGDGVFEVIRVYSGHPFAVEDHYRRMQGSADNLLLPIDIDAVRSDVGAALTAAGGAFDGLVRTLVTRGGHRIVLLEPMPEFPDTVALSTVTYAPSRILDGV